MHTFERSTKQRLTIYSSLALTLHVFYWKYWNKTLTFQNLKFLQQLGSDQQYSLHALFFLNTGTNTYISKLKIFTAAWQWPAIFLTRPFFLKILVQILTFQNSKIFLENFYIRIYKFNFTSLFHILRFHLSWFVVADNVKSLMLPSVFCVTVW
jgi:hypothetical protein